MGYNIYVIPIERNDLMLCFTEKVPAVSARNLMHSENIFHEALSYVRGGETVFHVTCPDGEYWLSWRNNEEIQHTRTGFPNAPLFTENLLFPDYLNYDETNIPLVYLDIFDSYTGIFFQELNEYSVVLVKLLLRYTDKAVYVRDSGFRRFFGAESGIRFAERAEELPEEKRMTVQDEFIFDNLVGRYDVIDPVCLFHNVFVLQYVRSLSERKPDRMIVNIPKTEGIGSILNNFFRIRLVAARYGIDVCLQSGCTRYSDELLQKYFRIRIGEKDNESTFIGSVFTLAFTHLILSPRYVLSKEILSPTFQSDLETYKQAVFRDKRILGVLVRGTDYIATNMPIQPLPVEEVIPLIEETMREGGYETIFLATEDQEYYEKLTAHFRGRICAVSQVRVRVRDLQSFAFLSNLEKDRSKEDGYAGLAEDNLCNYFYAIYLLSECQGFIGMPAECNGVVMTREFNGGRFELFRTFTKNVTPPAG